jgi:hypothetical protein
MREITFAPELQRPRGHLREERRELASGGYGRAKRKVGNMQQSCNAKEDSVRLSLVESTERRGSSVVEQPIRNRQVAGSSPALGSTFLNQGLANFLFPTS